MFSPPARSINSTLAAFVLLFLVATGASAAISPKYQAWRNGPIQWIMRPEDQKAWKLVKSDEEAIRFIDLFWARRDPTIGTLQNEFRDEFEQRVRYSDQRFVDRRVIGTPRAGSMTDRGRVYIVLGTATNMGSEMSHNTAQGGGTNAGDPTGGRDMGARDSWVWEHKDAQKFDMPKIEVIFIEDPGTGRVRRDPQRTDFIRASQVAVRKAVVNPAFTDLPEWVQRGGLEPQTVLLTMKPAVRVPVAVEPTAVEESVEPSASEVMGTAGSNKPGASRLTLLKDPSSLSSDSATDPFLQLTPASAFKAKEKLGWAAQYCSASSKTPALRYILVVTGPEGGESTDRVAPPKDAKASRLKSLAGCYVLRGSTPLAKMVPGTYQMVLMIEEPATGGEYDLRQKFRVE